MNEEQMNKVTEALVALSKEYGVDRDSDDVRLKIPANPDEALAFVRKFSWPKGESFDFDDTLILHEVQSLLKVHRIVWVIVDRANLRYDIYFRPDRQDSPVSSGRSGATESSTKGGGCFIATAVYGSPYASEVIILKEFRDNWLLNYGLGKVFVSFYYWISPPIANHIAKRNYLKSFTKTTLIIPVIKIAKHLKRKEK